MTQIDQVRGHLEAGKAITPVRAMVVYGIARLSSVIEDLRNTGTAIDCVLKHDEMGKQYGEYRLRKPIVVGSEVQVQRGYGMGLPWWVRRNKPSLVLSKNADASLVRFIRGKNVATEWLNDKELVCAS